tara:strand:+ start:14193 stop:15026 length:834 start_codon:yes stop_codon:yes gene_type:complete
MELYRKDKTEKNVLYLGMGYDIITPLILYPEVEKIFVMDLFHPTYSSDETLVGQRNDIVGMLVDGSNITSLTDDPGDDRPFLELTEPCTILHQAIYPYNGQEDGRWEISFQYNGKLRTLIVCTADFYSTPWPVDFFDIEVLIGFGAFSTHTAMYKQTLSREISKFKFPFTYNNQKSFNEHIKGTRIRLGSSDDDVIVETVVVRPDTLDEQLFNLPAVRLIWNVYQTIPYDDERAKIFYHYYHQSYQYSRHQSPYRLKKLEEMRSTYNFRLITDFTVQ